MKFETKQQKIKTNNLKGNTISVVIIARDEEEKIGEAIESAKWANETLVVDTGSVDKTVSIAEKLGARVVEYKKGSYSDWRNYGLKEAKSEWILYLDADERVTPALCNEIEKLINIKKNKYPNKQKEVFQAYVIPRKNIILGREMKHGGWWPDYVKRLYVKNSLKGWKGELHEEPEIVGEFGYLRNPLIHIKHARLSEMVEKTNVWSAVEAKLMFDAGHPPMNVPRFLSAMLREFWLRMVKHKAFLDGGEGVIYAIYQVFSKFISYAKLWEMQIITNPNMKSNNPNDPN